MPGPTLAKDVEGPPVDLESTLLHTYIDYCSATTPEVLDITTDTSHQSAGPQFRQSPSIQVVSSGHAQTSAISIDSGSTSLPTILRTTADIEWTILCRTTDEQVISHNQMTAYTDGYLGLIRKIFDILGVKAAHRDQKPPKNLRQEAAHMVAYHE
ncbi:hypothetical protein N7453_009333 [Penicillium expansum]|nr:hypothetical protein N7453_009333 [Penicillium expansum]